MASQPLVPARRRTFRGDATTAELRLEAVIAREYGRLVRLAGAICRDPADAQDAVLAAVERALRFQGSLRDPERAAAWLNQIVVREAIRSDGRRRTWWGRTAGGVREIEASSSTHDPGTTDAHLARAVRESIDALPSSQRAAVALHHYAGYSVEETAAILGVP